jgi:flavin-dependent dehydrogenase
VDACAVIIGGGPAGAAAGRLLASWGHRVLILHKNADRSRGLAESLPPSTLKLLAEIGVLDLVQRAGFYCSRGNTVWWGSRDPRVETFGPGEPGLQVFRPELDRLLLESAAEAGASIRANATARAVHVETGGADAGVASGARVEFDHAGRRESVSCRFVLDCSGRAGVLGRRFRVPGLRLYALAGAWRATDRWKVPDETHTLVEAYDNGWAWSVPLSASVRHVGLMVDGVSPRQIHRQALAEIYRAEIAKTRAHARLVSGATLGRVWACDASTYAARVYGGPEFLLVGDAGSFIDPLSSFGVKKALASAWIAAIVVNTCVTHPERQEAALGFFSAWERDICETHARRSREFAREASARHPSPFWEVRAAEEEGSAPRGSARGFSPDGAVHAAFDMLKESADLDLAMGDVSQLEQRPIIRGREIVLASHGLGGIHGVHYWESVDLLQLARMACRHRQVPDVYEEYCRANGPVPLPSVLGGLSLLVAKGILNRRNAGRC